MDFKSTVLNNSKYAKQLLDEAKDLKILDKVADFFKHKARADSTLIVPGIFNKYIHFLKHKDLFASKVDFLQKIAKAQQVHGTYVVSHESLKKNYRTIVLKLISSED